MVLVRALICMFLILVAPGMARADEGEAAENAAPKAEFEYVEMRPIVLPVINERGLTQQVAVVVSLEVPPDGVDEVKTMMPKLTDAYISDLYGAFGSGRVMKRSGLVNVPVLKDRLSRKTEKVMGPEKVHDVLINVVQQTPR